MSARIDWRVRPTGFLWETVVNKLRYPSDISRRQAEFGDERERLFSIRRQIAESMPDNPCVFGYKVYSQVDEDGIIQNILGRIPNHSRTFIEIGCGTGVENNTHFLALLGYDGCWIDGSAANIAQIKRQLGRLQFDSLNIINAFVNRDNIGALIDDCMKFIGSESLGFLSLDIDGNDLYVLGEIMKISNPEVVCVEYNAKFPPPVAISIAYSEGVQWAGDDYHGASLSAFCELLSDYVLVCCNASGANAFFVRKDKASGFSGYSISDIYQPARFELIRVAAGHPPTLKFLRDYLNARARH